MCIKINKIGKQEVGIWWVQKRFPRYGVPIWSLWPNIRSLPSIVAEKNVMQNEHIQCRLIRLCGCTCVRFIFWPRIFLLWRREKWYFFGWFFSDLVFLGGSLLSFDSFRYNRDPSMKNTESIGWLYVWFTFSPDYVCGMKQKLRTSRNKISMQIPVTGARCTIVWAIREDNAPYWHTHQF